MISLKPSSILQLTICGFLVVAGILIATLIVTARQFDTLSDQSQRIVSQSAMAMGSGRTLVEQTSAMERNARQYSIVGEPEILEVYADRRRTFGEAAQQLSDLEINQDMSALLNELLENEALAYGTLSSGNASGNSGPLYPQLLETAYKISGFINEWTNGQLESIRLETEATKKLLTFQSVLLVSIALVLAAFFTVLITRPLLQMEKAIKGLGSGAYKAPISISGPTDLVILGERLDWLRSRLGQLEQQRSSFLRHVSHELKTPLAALQESASLLGDGVVGHLNREQEEIIRIQSSNCQRLQALIDDLLRYNSESFSVLNAPPQPVRLDKVVENVISAHELIIKSGQLSVRCSLEKVTVSGEPEQLRVIVDNLVTNAIKYSPEGGEISISLRQKDTEIWLDVIDQGPGILAEESEKIFAAFYQGKPSGKDIFKGSGLGLAIVQEYVQANGGSIEIVLDNHGGAHFRLRFPPSHKDNT